MWPKVRLELEESEIKTVPKLELCSIDSMSFDLSLTLNFNHYFNYI